MPWRCPPGDKTLPWNKAVWRKKLACGHLEKRRGEQGRWSRREIRANWSEAGGAKSSSPRRAVREELEETEQQ